ncbi:Paired amphipathic helix protein Sin3b [Bulinus truncatus]|nr:Paired amphipathic helix protein Sin3b [Bulinus truncatus]
MNRKFPDLFREFRDLLGVNEQGDFNTCKRYGASYRGIPSKFVPPKCSGRSALCREVLNDMGVIPYLV